MTQLRFYAVVLDDNGNTLTTLYDDNDLDCEQLKEIYEDYHSYELSRIKNPYPQATNEGDAL